MATEKIGLEISLGGSGQVGEQMKGIETSVKSFRQQLREANKELNTSVSQFGATSNEAANAAKKVGELKEVMEKAKKVSQSYNPEEKFKSLSIAIQGVARGFEAYQGALGVIGVKSKDVEEQLAKVQSAMAFADGLSNLLSMKESFIGLYSVIKNQVVTSFTTLRGALIATGIGALAVALGLVIANFDTVKKAVLNLIPGLAKVGEWIGKVVDKITDMIGVTSEAERALDKLAKAQKANLENEEKWLDQNGDKYDQYTQKKYQAQIELQKKLADITKKAQDEHRIENEQDLKDIKAYKEKYNREIDKIDSEREEAVKKKKADQATADAAAKAKKDAKDKADRAATEKRIEKELKDDVDFYNRLQQEAIDAKKTADEKAADDKLKLEKGLAEALKTVHKNVADAEADLSKAKVNVTKDELLAKLDLVQSFGALMGQIAGNNKELAIAGIVIEQAASIAKIIANTGVANAKAVAASPLTGGAPWVAINSISAGLSIASTVAAAAKSIGQIRSGGSGGSGGISVPSIPSSASSTIQPQSQQAPTPVSINQNQVNQMGNRSNIRAYIIDADIQNADRRNQRIERASVLGG